MSTVTSFPPLQILQISLLNEAWINGQKKHIFINVLICRMYLEWNGWYPVNSPSSSLLSLLVRQKSTQRGSAPPPHILGARHFPSQGMNADLLTVQGSAHVTRSRERAQIRQLCSWDRPWIEETWPKFRQLNSHWPKLTRTMLKKKRSTWDLLLLTPIPLPLGAVPHS